MQTRLLPIPFFFLYIYMYAVAGAFDSILNSELETSVFSTEVAFCNLFVCLFANYIHGIYVDEKEREWVR